jgi:hypothetical protein
VGQVVVVDDVGGLGVGLSLDDFGTGYTSLRQLRLLPVTTLKIDRSFLSTVETADEALLGLLVHAAHAVDLKVIAEGVERLDQLEMLRSLGCGRGVPDRQTSTGRGRGGVLGADDGYRLQLVPVTCTRSSNSTGCVVRCDPALVLLRPRAGARHHSAGVWEHSTPPSRGAVASARRPPTGAAHPC